MEAVKKCGYFSIMSIFIITAITSIMEFVYIAGEYCFDKKLLPEPIWGFLDTYFYYEALPFRFLIVLVILVVLAIIMLIFYRKDVSITTVILSSTSPIICAVGWTAHYWIAEITEKAVMGYIIVSVICIVHIVATGAFLIKDKDEFDYI